VGTQPSIFEVPGSEEKSTRNRGHVPKMEPGAEAVRAGVRRGKGWNEYLKGSSCASTTQRRFRENFVGRYEGES